MIITMKKLSKNCSDYFVCFQKMIDTDDYIYIYNYGVFGKL